MHLTALRRLDQERTPPTESLLTTKRHHITGSKTSRPSSNIQPPRSSRKLDRQGLLLLHLPQVRLVAKGIWDRMRFAVELDDLIGYGTIGLLHAVERFDPGRGILLKTYAEHRIRGAILDGLRGMDWLPRSARQKERRQRQQPLEEAMGGVPPDPGTQFDAGRPGSKPESGAAQRPSRPYLPRMESVFPGGNLDDLERLAESARTGHELRRGGTNPERLYERKEKSDQLTAAIARLPRRHRQILDCYYRQEMSMRQIGAILQVHESRVSQLHAAALASLRKDLSARHSSAGACRKPPQRYSPELDSISRLTAVQSSSVSTPMVS